MQELRTLIPADLVFRTAVLLLVWIAFAVWILIGPPPAAVASELSQPYWLVGGFLILLTMFDAYVRKGYRVSYNENAIHWRKVGLRGRFSKSVEMPFRAITDVFAHPSSPGTKSFDVAVLRAGAHDIPDILLSRQYLRKSDIKRLLSEVSARSEAVFDERVREFMEAPD